MTLQSQDKQQGGRDGQEILHLTTYLYKYIICVLPVYGREE